MLDGSFQITSREHRYFFAATSIGLLLRLVEIPLPWIFPEPESEIRISFAIYSIFDVRSLMSPLYCIPTFALCLALAWRVSWRNVILSLMPLGLLTYFYDYWFIDSQLRIREAAVVAPEYEFKTFDFILLDGSVFDVVTFFLVAVLVVWHLRLLARLSEAETHIL
jgi:hypothetical protein